MVKTRATADLERGHVPCAVRLLDLAAVMAVTDLSESTILRRVKSGTFPKLRKIGPWAVRWLDERRELSSEGRAQT